MPLYKRKGSDHWWVRIGRHTRKSTGTSDRRQAEEFERVLTERLWRARKLGDRSALPWQEAADRWLKDSRKGRSRDREILKWLKPHIGEHAVSAVADPDVLEQLRRNGLEDGWSHSTVDRMMTTVQAILRACKRWRILESVPDVPRYGEVETEPRFLTRDEFAALCRELPPHLRLAAQFAVCTLLRMRAQSSLTWGRVDLEARKAWIPGTKQKGGKGFSCPLSTEALRILREVRQLIPGELVFGQEELNTKAFRNAAERAGIGHLRWHDLRHTGASWAVQAGISLPQLMDLGNWKTYRHVLRYARFAPSDTAAAAEVVGTKVAQIRSDENKKC